MPFAGYLLYYLAKNHCFLDGNKRVAWMSSMRVLAHFGLSLDATDDDAEQLVDDVVNDVITNGAGVVSWLEHHLMDVSLN